MKYGSADMIKSVSFDHLGLLRCQNSSIRDLDIVKTHVFQEHILKVVLETFHQSDED